MIMMSSETNKVLKNSYYYTIITTILALNLLVSQSHALANYKMMTPQSLTSNEDMGIETTWKMEGVVKTYKIAGSRLPDCLHACGSCSPCRLVMVHFRCSSLAEAETCPMAYKCMCNNKSYPVP